MKDSLYKYQSILISTTLSPQDRPLVTVYCVFTNDKKEGAWGIPPNVRDALTCKRNNASAVNAPTKTAVVKKSGRTIQNPTPAGS
jgi:hypothetical protein